MNKYLSKQQITQHYALRRVPARGANTPRKGFYWFKEVLDVKFIGDRLATFLLTAYYHPEEPDFTAGCLVQAQISSFYNTVSQGPEEMAFGEIIGAVIHVESVETDNYTYEDKPQVRYKVKWDIVDLRSFDDFEAKEISAPNNLELTNDDSDNEAEVIDEETEEVFYEANQPELYIPQLEIEILLDTWQAENELYNLNK